ncbi:MULTISPECIES: TolC family protein [Flavobacterium]|uniref:TolC family protein n=1 Tax=Flavobacterium TaxID=237 RepID=UPI00086ABFBE|nr:MULTISPECIES: TolC family protein [Flavobacterium]MBN9285420.1 TolC family protein [Flavobacterium sp.]ODS84413.1 MAG: transporter [Chryseobacterium sp. SCN 40-13]OJV71699.1 MAG: transporter [Flavobacterium sp. 40-81]
MKLKLFLTFVLLVTAKDVLMSQTVYDIKTALQTAKANNRELKTEQLNVQVAQADVVTAKLRPNLSLNNQTLQLAESAHYAPDTKWSNSQNRQVWWQLTKQFQLPSQRKNKIDVANKGVAVTEANYKDFERNLLTEVAMNWLDVWLSQKKWQTALMAKNNWDTLVTVNKSRLKNQVITTTDYSRTELVASQYNVLAQTAKQDYQNKLNNLKFILGVTDDITIAGDDAVELGALANQEELLNNAIENRSDINVLKSNIEVMKSNVSLQKSLAYPQPELGAVYNPQNNVPYVGIYATIDLPFFDRNQGEIKKSQVTRDKAEQELITSKEKIKTEISNAYTSYKQFEQNAANLKKMREQSYHILDNVKYAYMRGGTTLIDFLEAQRTWYDTQENYYEAIYQHKESYIKLLYTTGLIHQIAQ